MEKSLAKRVETVANSVITGLNLAGANRDDRPVHLANEDDRKVIMPLIVAALISDVICDYPEITMNKAAEMLKQVT